MKIWQIIIISLLLRLISLNQPLWLDEAISANVAKNNSYAQIVTNFSVNDFHPPLYYLTLKTWGSVFGYSEVSLRMPSVIFSLVTIYFVYLLAGNGAALLTGLNPLLIYYSQEARMYSMVTMILTMAVYFWIKKKYFWYNVAAFFSFMTFYGGVFLLAVLGIYWVIKKDWKKMVLTNIGIGLAIIILIPLLRLQMQNSVEMLATVKNWSMVLGKANLKNLLLIPMKFTSGRISFSPKILYYLVSGGFAVGVFSQMRKRNIYSFIFWMTLVVGTIFSIFTPMLQYFRFLYLIPIMAMVINKNKWLSVGFLIFSLVYLLNSNMWREDWRGAATAMGNKVYMISSFGDPVKYYKPGVEIQDIRSKANDMEITVVPYGEEIHGVNHTEILTNEGYYRKSVKDFRDLRVETWRQNQL